MTNSAAPDNLAHIARASRTVTIGLFVDPFPTFMSIVRRPSSGQVWDATREDLEGATVLALRDDSNPRLSEAFRALLQDGKAEGMGKMVVPFLAERNEAERIVYALGYCPPVDLSAGATLTESQFRQCVDTFGTAMTAETLERFAHLFMERCRTVDVIHDKVPRSVIPVESFIVRGAPWSKWTAEGSWVVGLKVYDEEVWRGIVDGELAGLSIGALTSFQKVDVTVVPDDEAARETAPAIAAEAGREGTNQIAQSTGGIMLVTREAYMDALTAKLAKDEPASRAWAAVYMLETYLARAMGFYCEPFDPITARAELADACDQAKAVLLENVDLLTAALANEATREATVAAVKMGVETRDATRSATLADKPGLAVINREAVSDDPETDAKQVATRAHEQFVQLAERVGAKISASRLTKITTARDLLHEVVVDVAGDQTADGTVIDATRTPAPEPAAPATPPDVVDQVAREAATKAQADVTALVERLAKVETDMVTRSQSETTREAAVTTEREAATARETALRSELDALKAKVTAIEKAETATRTDGDATVSPVGAAKREVWRGSDGKEILINARALGF